MANTHFLLLIAVCSVICFSAEGKSDCGGLIEVINNAVITSPGYPSNYTKEENCIWEIKTTEGSRIGVVFRNFSLEVHDLCTYDFVTIKSKMKDGEVREHGTFCGSEKIPAIISESNVLLIEFKSDSSKNYEGFKAELFRVQHQCGGLIEKTDEITGSLRTSPMLYSYPPDMNCTWTITPPFKHSTELKFAYFRTKESGGCDHDYVTVQSITARGETLDHGKFCNSEVPQTIFSENVLLIQFVSNGGLQYQGFMIEFYLEECGGLIEAGNGNITTPLYPESYPSNRVCEWTILAPPQHTIKLRFLNFETEKGGEDCPNDYLLVQRKTGEGEVSEYGKYCGKSPPFIYSKDTILLTFVSDRSIQYKGFMAEYFIEKFSYYELFDSSKSSTSYSPDKSTPMNQHPNVSSTLSEDCGGLIEAGRSFLSTPLYPESYPPNQICEWTIMVAPQHKLKLRFLNFKIEKGGDNCTNDFLLVQKRTAEGEVLEYGKYCGENPPLFIYSMDTILLTFVSDRSVQYKGFKVEYFIDKWTDHEISTSLKKSTTNPGMPTTILTSENDFTTSSSIPSTTAPAVANEQNECEKCIWRNETDILSEAVNILKEKVASIETSQKTIISNFENMAKNNGSSTSKNVFLKEVKNSSSPFEKQLLNDCGKYIFFLRRMLDSKP